MKQSPTIWGSSAYVGNTTASLLLGVDVTARDRFDEIPGGGGYKPIGLQSSASPIDAVAGVATAGSIRLANSIRSGVAKETKSLYHYTDDVGLDGILGSKKLNPSLKANNPKDARFGDGQYLSDIAPGSKTCAQLSRCFIGQPFQGNKFKNYVEIDVTDLNVIKGRDGVFVIPNDKPLDLINRILGSGKN